MRPILVLIVLFVTNIISYGQDNFSFDTKEYDFDTLYQGEVVNAIFLLKNTGKDPVYIKRINSGSDIASIFSSEPVMPGKCSMITSTYESKIHRGNIHHKLEVLLAIEEKDTLVTVNLRGYQLTGKRPNTKLVFTANNYNMGKVNSDEVIYYPIQFKNTGKHGAKVEDVNLNNLTLLQATGLPHFCSDNATRPMVGSNEIIGVGATGTILLKTPADLKPGIYKGSLELTGNFKKQTLRIILEIQ